MMTPKGVQKKLNRWATQKSKMAAILKMAAQPPPKIVEGIQKHRANHDTSIKFGRVIPKVVQKKLNRFATQKSKMVAILKMAAKLTSQKSGGNKETSRKS